MKIRAIAGCLCLIVISSTGFAQVMTSSGTGQMKGASMLINPDGNSFTVTATYGPPVFSVALVTGAPFSAEEIASQTRELPDGNRIAHAMPSVFIYRDAAGRTRTDRPAVLMSPNPTFAANIPLIPEIYDPIAGYQYFLDTFNRVAHRYKILPSTVLLHRVDGVISGPGNGENAPAFVNEPLGKKMIEGIEAEGRRTTATYPVGMMSNDKPMTTVTEYWNSTDLKVTVYMKSESSSTGENLRALINIKRAQPDPSLFQVPPEYKVVDETGTFTTTFTVPKKD